MFEWRKRGYSANFILEVCAFVYISLEKRKTWKKTFGWWDCGCLAPPPPTETLVSSEI